MQGSSFRRMYVLLRPAAGQGNGFARVESQRGRGRVSIHASHLPAEPVRALLLAGDGETGAVLDLGLVNQAEKHQAVLCREDVSLQGWHTLALATDWPGAQLLLYGWLRREPCCTLWQMQQAVQRYLSLPAGEVPPEVIRSVLMLRGT